MANHSEVQISTLTFQEQLCNIFCIFITGIFDAQTQEQMEKPRCLVPDSQDNGPVTEDYVIYSKYKVSTRYEYPPILKNNILHNIKAHNYEANP